MENSMQFPCPKCSTISTVPMPEGEVMMGVKFSTVIYANREHTCPGCQAVFLSQLQQFPYAGQVWGFREIVPAGKIIVPKGPQRLPPPPKPHEV